MGEFTEAPGPATTAPEVEEKPKEFKTDVDGVMASDIIKHGTEEFPVFDCTENEFYQNMQQGRRRLRFKNGSAVSNYMNQTKYKRPFFIRTTDSKGQTYTRKIK